jgi:hypothetical protein
MSPKVTFDKKLVKMLTRVSHSSGGNLRSQFELRLHKEMGAFVTSGASQCFDISCRYDSNLTGMPRESDGLNALHAIHDYYSAQQNIAEKGNGGEYTFAEVMAANSTMSVAEFAKVSNPRRLECARAQLSFLFAVSVRHGTVSTAKRRNKRNIPNNECGRIQQ